MFCMRTSHSATIGPMPRRSAAWTILLALFLPAGSKPAQKVVVPDHFRVKFETSKGDFIVEVTRAGAPHGADRSHELIRMRYFNEARFFRVFKVSIAQFGV